MSFSKSYAPQAFLLALCASAAPAAALAAPAQITFDIGAGPLDQALVSYSRQSGRQLLYSASLVSGRNAPAVKGRLTADEALKRLIAGSDLVIDRTTRGSIVLRAKAAPYPAGRLTPLSSVEPQGAVQSAEAIIPAHRASEEIAEVVVTGSHLRGVKDGPSQVVVLDSEAIAKRGFATLDETVTSLPQNFGGGGGSPTTLLTGADPLGTNSFASTGVNLRGLGTDATLVLVNGRRMAGTGSKGDFADLSAIPVVAVQRVEVLVDGASALYGSDAVGGVVNIRLRRDLDGAETRLRYGVASGGEAEETQFSQVFGKTWAGGHGLIAYERYHRQNLPSAARDYAASSDLRPFGGTDHRVIYSAPGNVVQLDPATSNYTPIYAIRPGANGAATSPSDFVPGQVNLENQRQGLDLLPDDRRDSLYAFVGQSLTPWLEVEADARYTRRRFDFRTLASTGVITVRATNPYYVALPGLTSQQIAYGYGDDLGPVRSSGLAESLGATLALKADLWGDWRSEAYLAFAQEVGTRRFSNTVNTRLLSEALGAIPDDPATSYSAARDGYFNPYGAGGANGRAVLDFIGSGFSEQTSRSRVETLALQADGTLFRAPGGPARLAVGLQLRNESFDQKNLIFTSTATPRGAKRPGSERRVSAAFAELRIPLIGDANSRAGLHRLDLSLAGRIEDYDDVGSTADPKLGLIWKPNEDLNLRASYGTSFRAPTLVEVFEAGSIGASFLPQGPGRTLSVIRYGGNPSLKPESATSWSAGFDYAPAALAGLHVSATWFDTTFEDRIARPALDHVNTALSDPTYAPFVRFVDPRNPTDLALVTALINDATFAFPGAFPPEAYGAIVDARYVNTASTRVSGLDVSGSYSFERDEHRFEVSLSATWLGRFEQTLTPTSPPIETLDTPGEPADLRGRASLDWNRGAWGATVSANYVDGYSDGMGGSVASWTTVDVQGRWRTSEMMRSPWRGLSLSLGVRNLLDEAPPFYDAFQGVGFDAANASPMGRVVSLQLSKTW